MCGENQINQLQPTESVETDTLQAPEENAKIILDIFILHFKLLAGEALSATNLSGAWYERQKSKEDMVQGIEYAKSKGWLKPLDEAFELTEAGYHATGK